MSYQVAFLLGGKKIIPAPFVRFARQAERSADGKVRRRYWTVAVTGKVAAFAGSPANDGTFWTGSGYPPAEDVASNDPSLRIRNLRNKLGALSALFEQEPLSLEIIPGDGSASIRSVLRQTQFVYAEGNWFDTVDFSLEAEADTVWFGDVEVGLGDDDQTPEEQWSLEPSDETGRAYRLVHTVAAVSRDVLAADGSTTQQGWERAKALCLAKLGFDQTFLTAAGVLDLATFAPHNYTRTVQTDKAGGRVTVTESWLCADPDVAGPTGKTAGRALEDFTVETRYDRESGRTQVTASGTITGLEERNPTTFALVKTRWENAALRYAAIDAPSLLAAAQTLSGVTLNPDPTSVTVGRNKITGVISYSTGYDDSPARTTGVLSEQLEVEFENPTDVFAEFVIPGRTAGPLYQPLLTRGRRAVTVSVSYVVPVTYSSPTPTFPAFDPLAAAISAIGSTPSQMYLVSDRPRLDARNGRYTRQSTFVYQ